jgi:hypothetical protein
MAPELAAFLDQVSVRLPGDGGGALADLELALVVLVSLVAFAAQGHETKPLPEDVATRALDLTDRISKLLPDARAVATITAKGVYRQVAIDAIAAAVQGHRNRQAGYVA